MTVEEYYQLYGSRITQDSERLFIDDFLYPLLGSKIGHIEPQRPLDCGGKCRRIDFAYHGPGTKIALEVNGETYHAEGIIPDEGMFERPTFSARMKLSGRATCLFATPTTSSSLPTGGRSSRSLCATYSVMLPLNCSHSIP